ncbi:hypothetical protein F5Y16DRAFT_401083 [Xylariaceae sp. FL0255]|nr:hypothetical protein F5Y16DRAFT_401083 [Xylariaceae sp. FL0255]
MSIANEHVECGDDDKPHITVLISCCIVDMQQEERRMKAVRGQIPERIYNQSFEQLHTVFTLVMAGPPNTQLVRSFSDDLNKPAGFDTLTRGLAARVTLERHYEKITAPQEGWDYFLHEGADLAKRAIIYASVLNVTNVVPAEEVLLREQSRRLYEAWSRFCKKLPGEEQKAVFDPPSIKFLHATVSRAAESWNDQRNETRTGRAKKIFTRAIEQRMKKHAELEFERNTMKRLETSNKLQDEMMVQQAQMILDLYEMRSGLTRQNELIYQLGASVVRLLAERPASQSGGIRARYRSN